MIRRSPTDNEQILCYSKTDGSVSDVIVVVVNLDAGHTQHGWVRLPIEDYMRRYFIGHYSPAGNHFFAFSVKNTIVEWLDPKPVTYRQDAGKLMDFEGYLRYG